MEQKINKISLNPIGMSVDENGRLWQDYELEINISVMITPNVQYIEIQTIPYETIIDKTE